MGVELTRVWATVPCMGRLEFLKQTLPVFFAEPALRYCLVDYACPDRCGDWAEQNFSEQITAGRLTIERVRGETQFHKSRAHNRGLQRALAGGATFVCFLDADTRVRPGFAGWLAEHLTEGRFVIAARKASGKHARSTGGLLVVSAADLARAGGFDEAFVGWGCEDVEMRLRLHLAARLEYDEMPLDLLDPIQHSNEARTRFYAVKQIRESELRNRKIVERRVKEWTGASTAAFGPEARRLLMGRIWNEPLRLGPSRFLRRSWR